MIGQLKGLSGISAWLVYNKVIFNLLFLRRFNSRANDQSVLIMALKECRTLEEYKEIAGHLTIMPENLVHYTMAGAVAEFRDSNDSEKRGMLLEALTCIDLANEDKLLLLALHTDSNGVRYGKANVNNLLAGELINMLIESLMSCAVIDCNFGLLNSEDLELSKKYRVDIRDEANDILSNTPDAETGNVIALSLKKILAKMKV